MTTTEQARAIAIAKAKVALASSGKMKAGLGELSDMTQNPAVSEEYLARNRPEADSTLLSTARGAVQGITFGASDEILAGLLSLHPRIDYDTALRYERGKLDADREQHPIATYGGEIAGAVAVPVGSTARGGTLAAQAGRGALAGMATGGVYGFNSGEGVDRAKSAAIGAGTGMAVGALVPLLGAALSKPVEKVMQNRAIKQMVANAPSTDQLAAQAQKIYQQADQVSLPRGPLAAQAQAAIDDATRYGMDPMLTPSASRVADNLADAATKSDPNISYRELDVLRRQAAIPAGDVMNRPQSAMGQRFQQAVDDFIDQSDPALASDLAKARALWGKMRRSEMIGDIIDKSEGYLGGTASGIRNQIGSILRNPKKLRGFSEAEVALMKKIASGGLTNRVLTLVGSGMGRIGAMILGGATGGVEGTAVGAAIGMLGREASDKLLMKQGFALKALAAAGGASLPKLSAANRNALDALLMGAGRVGANELQERLTAPN